MNTAPGTAFQRQKGFDMLVLGGGVAGLTTAWHGARLGISVALIEQGPLFGGQVATLGVIDDYPATSDQSGAELAAHLLTMARLSGASITEDTAVRIRPTPTMFAVETLQCTLNARSVVIATGARLRKLDLPEAPALEGRGISQCATCDGAFYRNRDVVVVGGGDGALQAAIELARLCSSVTVVARGRLRARRAYIDAAAKRANLRFVWDSTVDALLGNDGIAGVHVRNLKSGASTEIACFGVFPFIGLIPNSQVAADTVALMDDGRIRTGPDFSTNIPGIYAIGAVREGHGGALASAAGEGAAVARTIAERYRR